jgi:hypothetical protein
MKKQLLIAAVAATMTSVAMADISITGGTKVNYTTVDFDGTKDSTNNFKHEVDLAITGKTGDTTVVVKLGNMEDAAGTGIDIEDSYLTTKVGDVSMKAGTWDNGNNALRASSRATNKFSASTTMGGLTLTGNANSDATGMGQSVKVAGSAAGVNASYEDTDGGETIALSTSVAGMSVSYLALNSDTAASDRSVVEVSGSFGGMGVKVAQASADTAARIQGDSWMGDYETGNVAVETTAYDLGLGQDVTAIELSTSMAGNSVKFRNVNVDGGATAATDMSFNKIIITRPLANGTTFEATYTDLDDSDAANDSTTLDLELAVKF